MTDCIKVINPRATKQTGGKNMAFPHPPSANLSSVYYENYCWPLPSFLFK